MSRTHDLNKPGEKAPADGWYYCYVCAQRGTDSRREMKAGELFAACPNCLERKVAEWDLTWRAAADGAAGAQRKGATSRWPGAYGEAD